VRVVRQPEQPRLDRALVESLGFMVGLRVEVFFCVFLFRVYGLVFRVQGLGLNLAREGRRPRHVLVLAGVHADRHLRGVAVLVLVELQRLDVVEAPALGIGVWRLGFGVWSWRFGVLRFRCRF